MAIIIRPKTQPNISPVKAIIFDLDGTLVDSLGPTLEAFNEAILAQGLPRHTPAEIMAHFGSGEHAILTRIVGPENADKAYQICRDAMARNMGQMPLHSDVPELLERLRRQDIPLAIVTGRGEGSTHEILEHHGLSHYFVTVICHEHVSRSKPAPEGIELALKRMDLKPQDACYVGDMSTDIHAAHSAGTRSVAVLWDALCRRDELLAVKPHHVIESPLEILGLV